MDIDWLEKQISDLFDKNRVAQLRGSQGITYHAPYLNPKMEYPPWVPSQLHWLWRPWWRFTQPLRVNYPTNGFGIPAPMLLRYLT